MKKIKKDSLINRALLCLKEKSIDLLDLTTDIVFDPKKLIVIRLYGGYSSYPISKKFSNLKRSPYFLLKNDKLYLTEKGRVEIIRKIIKNKKKIKKWDGKWRSIIFDIPEANRRERNFLRKELKWMGFKELQHSVWITPYNIKDELLTLLELWHKDFKGNIKFLEIEKITEDTDIKKNFNL